MLTLFRLGPSVTMLRKTGVRSHKLTGNCLLRGLLGDDNDGSLNWEAAQKQCDLNKLGVKTSHFLNNFVLICEALLNSLFTLESYTCPTLKLQLGNGQKQQH